LLSSFTKNEKKLLLSFAGLLLVGSVVSPYLRRGAKADVFPAASAKHAVQAAPPAPVAGLVGGPPAVAPDGRINLNSADQKTLESIPGIGPAKASAIIEYRTKNGGFRTVQELDAVRGIGAGIMAKVAPLVTVGAPAAASPLAGVSGANPTPAAGQVFGATGEAGEASLPPASAQPVQPLIAGIPPQPVAPTAPVAAVPAVPVPSAQVTGLVNINTASYEQLQALKYVGPAKARAIIEHRTRSGPFPTVESLDAVKGIGRQVLDGNRGRMVVR
jgi:competence ComEA-like helix-hairpin-helix protein